MLKSIAFGIEDVTEIAAFHRLWRSMNIRCYTKTFPGYRNWGGRGITVCDAWRNSFEQFISDMWPRPKNTSIDRINNDGNYEPTNCRWATPEQQGRNRRTNLLISIDGESKTMIEFAESVGLPYMTFRSRIRHLGWTPAAAAGKELRVNPLTSTITFGGETLPFKQMAAKHGLGVVCLRKRLAKGWTLKKALTTPLSSRGGKASKKRIMLGGVETTIKDAAKKHKQVLPNVYARLNLGWNIEEALGIVKRLKKTWK